MAIFMRSPQMCWFNESRSGDGLLLDNQLDGDIAPRGIRVRTDFVGKLNEFLSRGFVYTRHEDMEFDVESEACSGYFGHLFAKLTVWFFSIRIFPCHRVFQVGLFGGVRKREKALLVEDNSSSE